MGRTRKTLASIESSFLQASKILGNPTSTDDVAKSLQSGQSNLARNDPEFWRSMFSQHHHSFKNSTSPTVWMVWVSKHEMPELDQAGVESCFRANKADFNVR